MLNSDEFNIIILKKGGVCAVMLKKRIVAFVAMLLALLFISSSFPASAADKDIYSIDCSDPSSPTAVKVLKASELLSLITGEKLPSAESAYIDSVLEEAFFYSDSIPSSKVQVNYDGENVYVSAESYEYVSSDGIQVSWIPTSIKLDGAECALTYSEEDDTYKCEVGYKASDNGEEIVYVNVDYEFEFLMPEELGDRYKNYVYSCAFELCEEANEYELRLEAYEKYQQYVADMAQYQKDIIAWEKYKSVKAQYDIDIVKYNAYAAEYAEYEKQLLAYNAYMESVNTYDERVEAYKAYLAAKADYDAKYNEYEIYMGLLSKAEAKLAAIDNAFVKSSKGNILYNTLWGPTVEEVISRQEELVNLGQCDPRDIRNAGKATENLKVLLKGYYELSEREDKYNYYVQNYKEIKDNFILLYRSLHILFENEAVYAGVVIKEKLSRYVEFLSHLYVIQSALDDSVMRDDEWQVKGEYNETTTSYKYYKYYEALEECQIIPDTNNADPSDLLQWPDKVDEPVADFEAVEYPVILPKIDEPIEPDKVKEPVKPEEMKEPVEPDTVEDPGERPQPRLYTSLEKSIMDAYTSGDIKHRSEDGASRFTLRTSCKKRVPLDDRYVVTFYDDDGSTVLYQYFAGYEDIPEYKGAAIEKQGNEKYSYYFDNWRDESVAEAVFDEITVSEVNFYASYTAKVNKYKVTWIVDGYETYEWYEYGQMPAYKYEAVKLGDENTVYTFAGWSEIPDRVVKDVSYEALFEASTRYYNITFIVDGTVYSEKYRYGELPEFKGDTYKAPFQNFVYIFRGWNKDIAPVTESAVYVADYSEHFIAEDENGNSISVTNENDTYMLSVKGNCVRVDRLAALADMSNRDIKISFFNGKCNVLVSALAASSFMEHGGAYIKLIYDEESEQESGLTVYSLELLSEELEAVSLDEPVTVLFRFDNSKIRKYTKIYSVDESSAHNRMITAVSNGNIVAKLDRSTKLVLKNEYPITVDVPENGVVVPDKREAAAGQKVSFSFVIDDAYFLSKVSVVGDISGKYYALDSDGAFVMPEEPISLTAVIEERLYTVVFVVDGKIISKQDYRKGDKVILPEPPSKESTSGKIYHFIGWEPIVTSVNKDTTYNAVFKELLEQDQHFVPDNNNRFTFFVICVAVIVVITFSIIIMGSILLVKRKTHRKKIK